MLVNDIQVIERAYSPYTDDLHKTLTRRDKIVAEMTKVAEAHGITYAEMLSKYRYKYITRPRQLAIAHIRLRWPHLSLHSIARLFGGLDHTSVIYAIKNASAYWRCRACSLVSHSTALQLVPYVKRGPRGADRLQVCPRCKSSLLSAVRPSRREPPHVENLAWCEPLWKDRRFRRRAPTNAAERAAIRARRPARA